LLDLHPDVINSITNSTINRSIAQELSYVTNKSQQPKLASLMTKGQLCAVSAQIDLLIKEKKN
jgi:hypothetical protein